MCSRHRRYCCWQYRNDPGYSSIGIHADNDTAAAASKIFSLAIPSSSERELHKIMCINHLAKPFFKDFSRENWVEHMFFHKDTLTHIFKDDEMDSFFFLCGCLMDSPYNHMLFQQICVDIIGGVLLVPNIGVGFFFVKSLLSCKLCVYIVKKLLPGHRTGLAPTIG